MNKYEAFTILLDNLSVVYIFTTVVTIVTLICTFLGLKYINSSLKENESNQNTEEENLNKKDDMDDVEYDDHSKGFLGQLRSAKLKKFEEFLTEEQKVEEKNIEKEQLAAIYKLLKEQESIYNTAELDEKDLKEQLKLYR